MARARRPLHPALQVLPGKLGVGPAPARPAGGGRPPHRPPAGPRGSAVGRSSPPAAASVRPRAGLRQLHGPPGPLTDPPEPPPPAQTTQCAVDLPTADA